MVSNIAIAGLFIAIIWLIVLSFFFWKLYARYEALTDGGNKKTLPEVLEQLMKDVQLTKHHIAEITKRCDKIEKEGSLHIQKVGLLRFNPFKDTGGDQSFILALVDANDTGVVISGLYSRAGTRWYAKRVVDGKGFEYDLSEEEKKALKLAKTV